jgi:large subunit ribosomal protein L17
LICNTFVVKFICFAAVQNKMRHGDKFRQIRAAKPMFAMMRSMSESLFEHEAIRTTVAKAKEVRRFAEKVITHGKLGKEKQVKQNLYRPDIVRKVMYVLGPRYFARPGGYTRILKCGPRQGKQNVLEFIAVVLICIAKIGDGAEMAVIELVDRENEIRPKHRLLISHRYVTGIPSVVV